LAAGKEDILKQSTGKKNRENTAAIYVRLSREDGVDGDSNSIQTQKKLLTAAAKKMGYTNLLTYCDDGITGVATNRKDFQKMLADLEKGKASALFIKDLSRLYRNRTEADRLVEDFFPEHQIRLVSIGDGIDTAEGDDEFIFLRNWANEQYAKDISKKRRLSNTVRGNSGEPLSLPPFGYIKDPDNPKRWIVDEDAADIVRRIYGMSLDGMGIEQIATALQGDGIMTPTHYWISKGVNRPGLKACKEPDKWNHSTVAKILSLQEYCGDVINFKTYSKSFKHKQRIANSEENMAIFRDVHKAIIDRATWEKVQQKRGKVRKRKQQDGEHNMFSGLLVCADCGGNMNFHFNQKNHDIQYFNCSNNNSSRKTCPTTHYIRVDFLEQVVLGEIRRLTRFASRYEDQFAQVVMGHSQQTAADEQKRKRKELDAMTARDRELDTLFERIYEDNVAGKISDERFVKMSAKYEQEQAELSGKIKALRAELEKATDKSMTSDMFISTVRKYTRAKKLSPRMLNELVERIEVHQAEKVDGVHVQRLTIHYHCVGEIDIPDVLSLPVPDVQVQTRKGVTVAYSA
jgi:DNA invertase Pin-like site-specific DNA recombinase